MSEWAILDGNNEVIKKPMLEAAKWLETNRDRKRVARDTVGESDVSTIFLGIDHSWDGNPLWFETMIFGGKHDQWMDRYSTYEMAKFKHEQVVNNLRLGLTPDGEKETDE